MTKMGYISKHIRKAALLCCLPALLAACGGNDEPTPASGDGYATLLLTTEVAGQTRATVDELPSNEKMQKLRIIIVRPNGKVEINQKYDVASNNTEHLAQLKVVVNETKTIYLVANEDGAEGLSTVLDAATVGSSLGSKLTDFSFTPQYNGNDKPIPMSSCYKVYVGEEEETIEKTLYVVRTATKFTFTFTNNSTSNAIISNLSISSVADKTYLLPHFNSTDGFSGASEDFYVKRATDNSLVSFSTATDREFWIDWMQRVVDESNTDEENTDLSDEHGWITGYSLPNDATHTAWKIDDNKNIEVSKLTSGKSGTATYGPVYLCESKYLMNTGATINDEQEYTLGLKITDKDGTKEAKTFSEKLPNLRSLFRNTHVKIDVVFSGVDAQIYAGIVYWGIIAEVDGIIEKDPDQKGW